MCTTLTAAARATLPRCGRRGAAWHGGAGAWWACAAVPRAGFLSTVAPCQLARTTSMHLLACAPRLTSHHHPLAKINLRGLGIWGAKFVNACNQVLSDFSTCPSLAQAKINSRGFGILDIKFVDDKLGYACGGSGSLFKTGAACMRHQCSAVSRLCPVGCGAPDCTSGCAATPAAAAAASSRPVREAVCTRCRGDGGGGWA